MKNVIAFKNGFVLLPVVNKTENKAIATSIQAELMRFGFILDNAALEMVGRTDEKSATDFYNEVITYLRSITGGIHNYEPFYKGFPTQVMELSEAEMWADAMLNYWVGGDFKSVEWAGNKSVAFEQTNYTTISVGNEAQFNSIFTDLVSVNQSLTPEDLKTVEWFVKNHDTLNFPEKVPFKETLSTVVGGILFNGNFDRHIKLPKLTLTDVMRICVYISGGDTSLPKVPPKMVRASAWSSRKVPNKERDNFKFRKLNNKERRFVLNLIENSNCDIREMKLKANRWIRLGEILHPMSYKNKFPKTFDLFYRLRNEKVTSWYGEVDANFEKSLARGLEKLSERSGEYVRRLDQLVRKNPKDIDLIINEFGGEVFDNTSNKVLYETYSHFEKRKFPATNRKVMIKGARKAVELPILDPLNEKVIDTIQEKIVSSLKNKFSDLDSLGKVWIDPDLKKIPVPTNMRSMNDSLKPIVRGSRMPLGFENPRVIRAFVHWYDERGNRDLDLTALYLSETSVTHIGWNGSKNTPYGLYSGDVRNRRGACAEYIDIVVGDALSRGFKYVVLDVRNYNGGTLAEITDCVAGFETRNNPESNSHWLPSSLVNSQRLQSSSGNTIISFIDLETMEYIFLDIDSYGIPVASANFREIYSAIEDYLTDPKFSVYDLLELHATSRGVVVDNIEEADNVFKFEDFSTSYVQTLKYMGV